jgi:AraC-like DNA-binding protein
MLMKQPMSCTGRFVRPFLVVLAQYPGLEAEVAKANSRPIESRIDVESVQDLVVQWVGATRDADLGLRAGQVTCLGTGGALDYALRTAQTLRESIQLAQRYAKLYSDALEITVVGDHDRDRVSIQIGSQVPAPRALTDFMLATWYRNHLQPHLGSGAALECCFSYPEPTSLDVHRRVFGSAKLRFGESFDGFSFDDHALDRVLASADPSLHDVHCKQLELIDWPAAYEQQPLAVRVRRLLAADLRQGRPSSTSIASRLQMSRRTLVRQLAIEGTSFKFLLDELRHQLALHLIARRGLSLPEVSNALGFVHVQAFHRCFKRWTGSTPGRYRVAARQRPAAA